MVGEALVDLPLFLSSEQFVVRKDGKSGAVIAAIFQPPQAFQDDWSCLLFADISNNAAHKSNLVPVQSRLDPFFDGMGWIVAPQRFRFRDVGLRMENISRTKGLVLGTKVSQVRVIWQQLAANDFEQFVQGGAGAQRHLKNLIDRGRITGRGREEVCLDDIGDIKEVPAG